MRWRWRWSPHRETPLTSHCPKVKATRSSIHPSIHPSNMGAEDKLGEAVISFLPRKTAIVSGANVSVNVRAASRTGVQWHGMTGPIRTLSVTLTDTACKSSRRDGQPDGWLPVSSSSSGLVPNNKNPPFLPKQSPWGTPSLLPENSFTYSVQMAQGLILKRARLGNYSLRRKQGGHGRVVDQKSG